MLSSQSAQFFIFASYAALLYSFYSYMRLKSVISGEGQGPTALFVSNNVRSITHINFRRFMQSLTLDVLQFEHN